MVLLCDVMVLLCDVMIIVGWVVTSTLKRNYTNYQSEIGEIDGRKGVNQVWGKMIKNKRMDNHSNLHRSTETTQKYVLQKKIKIMCAKSETISTFDAFHQN